VASRVADLPTVVQRANDYRTITGLGLAFLSIPRTYYGLLDASLLEECLNEAYAQDAVADEASSSSAPPTVENDLSKSLLAALRASGAVDSSGAADLALVAALIAAEEPETDDEKAVREAKEAAAAAEKEAAVAAAADGLKEDDPMAHSLAEWAGQTPPGGKEVADAKKARVGCEALDLALDSLAAPGRSVPEAVRNHEDAKKIKGYASPLSVWCHRICSLILTYPDWEREFCFTRVTCPNPFQVRRGASTALRFSAYRNLHALLEDKIDEAKYLRS